MAIIKKLSDEDVQRFEKDLLAALKNDPQHQFAFDGKLHFFSSRYGCEIKAVNVLWDPDKGDLVLVGAFLSGAPVIDMSKGFPVFKTEFAIPFSECYRDMKENPSADESMLISKSRKAVIDKCLGYPMKLMKGTHLEGGRICFDDYLSAGGPGLEGGLTVNSGLPSAVAYGTAEVSSVREAEDGRFIIESDFADRSYELNLSGASLCDIQKIGNRILDAYALTQQARKVFCKAKEKFVRPGSTSDQVTDRMGEAEGLASVFEKGYPLRVCDSVAKTFCVEYANYFSDAMEYATRSEIQHWIRNFRKTGWLEQPGKGKKPGQRI